MRPPPIAILLPVYNGAKHLSISLSSALKQRGVDFEIWAGDDGSTDGSEELLERYRCPQLHIVPRSNRLGLFGNLNRLIRASRSPFFHILCQDDILEPHCLARELRLFSRFPRVGITFAKSHVIDPSGGVLYSGALFDLPQILRPELCLQHFFYHGCIPSNLSTVAVRKSVLDAVGLFDERFRVSGDFELWTRVCRRYDMGVIHEHLVRIRSHPAQLSRADASGPSFVSENREIRSRLVTELPLSVQTAAGSFERLRYGVLDFHYAIRSLFTGRFKNAIRVFKTLGIRDSMFGALNWLVSVNNRLFRPTARFVLH